MRLTEAAIDASAYLRSHPELFGRAVRNAIGLRFGIPLDILRWLAEQASSNGKVEDLKIDPVPPGLRVGATLELMKTPIRAQSTVYLERIRLSTDEMKIEVRLEDVELKMAGTAKTPLAALIQSGSLDLSKPGNLARFMPLPPFVAEARDNRFTLDFARHPKIKRNSVARRLTGLVTSFVTVSRVETDGQHLDVHFRTLPEGVFHAAGAVRREVIVPSIKRLRRLVPG